MHTCTQPSIEEKGLLFDVTRHALSTLCFLTLVPPPPPPPSLTGYLALSPEDKPPYHVRINSRSFPIPQRMRAGMNHPYGGSMTATITNIVKTPQM